MTDYLVRDTAPRDLLTVAQFSERFPAWTQASLRNLILYAEDRVNSRGEHIPGNGFACAIVRLRRRVLLDPQAWFRVIAEQQKRSPHKATA